MEFRILGDLEADTGRGRLVLGGPSERRLLAILLLDADRMVPLNRLVDGLWDGEPPATAAKQVRNAVLRNILANGLGPHVIETHGGGYRLVLPRGALDAWLFDAKVAQAGSAASAGRLQEAVQLLRSALALWRGPALAGIGGRVVEAAAAGWNERRYAVLETCYGYELALGRHREILGQLAGSAADHPLREKLAGQRMLALYRCGRQADALAVYRGTRTLLSAELGLDPGPELQRLHQQILTADPALAVSGISAGHDCCASGPARHAAAPVAPQQLPGALRNFTGRHDELKTLTGLLAQVGGAGGTGGTVVISAIGGTAGIGKTTLAVYFAHQVAAQFPDGQLYVNLRGFDPVGSPVTPTEAVRGFLDAFGVPPERIPVSLDAQVGLYRSLLAGRRVLVVADNARDAEQVRPLLPGNEGCLVVVTSRNSLTSLIAAEGAFPLTLDLLTQEEAGQLLGARLGRSRVAAEPRAVQEIITSCARLPLALSVVAARAAAHARFPLAALAAKLADTCQEELDAFDGGDATTDVRAVFSWSYQQLTVPAARLFRLLGLHPGPDVTAPAAASLAGMPTGQAGSALAELARAHLITEHVPGRFAYHDLLRAYATELTRTLDPEAERRTAVRRMLDHYLHTAHTAAQLLNPHPFHRPITLSPPCTGSAPEQLADGRAAWTWFEAEHPVLLAASKLAATAGWDTHAWQLPSTLRLYFARRGRWHDLAVTQHIALDAARNRADQQGEAHAHLGIGDTCGLFRRHDEACTHFQQALALFVMLGDQAGQASAHRGLGWVLGNQGRPADGLLHSEQALALFRAAGHRHGQADVLNDMGWDHAQGLLPNPCLVRAGARPVQGTRDHRGEAATLDSLGYACHHLGRLQNATAYYQQAISLYRELGDRYSEATILGHFGDTCHAADEPTAARAAWQQALDILDQLGHPDATEIRNKLNSAQGPSVVTVPAR